VHKLRWLGLILVPLVVGGCGKLPIGPEIYQDPARPAPSVTDRGQQVGEESFWVIVEDVRSRADNDPALLASALDYKLYDANDRTIRTFQDRFAAASKQLFTWRHSEAAGLICGALEPDRFASWRYWVIAQGRAVFDKAVADPDSLAAVPDLKGGCDAAFESVGWAASGVWYERYPDGGDGIADLDFTSEPAGTRLPDGDAIRAALPALAAEN
jgi:hypothetical protein